MIARLRAFQHRRRLVRARLALERAEQAVYWSRRDEPIPTGRRVELLNRVDAIEATIRRLDGASCR